MRKFWQSKAFSSIRLCFPLEDEGKHTYTPCPVCRCSSFVIFIRIYTLASQQQERQSVFCKPLPKTLHVSSVSSSWDLFQNVVQVWLDLEAVLQQPISKSTPFFSHKLPVTLIHIWDRWWPNLEPGQLEEVVRAPPPSHLSPHFRKWGTQAVGRSFSPSFGAPFILGIRKVLSSSFNVQTASKLGASGQVHPSLD